MGNAIDTRMGFDGGYIFIKSDQEFYYPGNMVTGKIYIRADRPIDAEFLEIKVKGKEKASFWEQE
jgi:hypothetical protein